MSKWKTYKIKDITKKIISGGTPPTDKKEYYDGEIPWLNSKEIRFNFITDTEKKITEAGLKNSSAKWVEPNSVIVAMYCKGTVGKVAINKIPLTTNQACCSLIINEKIADYNFVYYYLRSSYNKLNALASGSAQQNLNIGVISDFEISLPTLPEQRAIASIFPPIEDKIELLRQENETLEAMAETIFKQWFIKDPENKEVLLKDIYVFEKGFEPGSSNYLETEGDDTIRFIRLKDMDNKNSSIFIKKSLAKNICAPDDLLVAFDGSPGKIGFGIEGAFSSGIRKVYSVNETYNNVWLKYLIFKSKPIQNTIKTYSTGTIIQHAGSCIDKLTFKFPEESKIKEFNELITPIFIKIQQNTQQLQTLSQLFDTLLHGLMSGKLRVDDVLCQS